MLPDNELQNSEAYREGRLGDDVDLSIYDRVLVEDDIEWRPCENAQISPPYRIAR